MKIKISPALKKLDIIDYRELTPLQGNLKDLNEASFAKLKKSLNEKGFFIPFFVWHCKKEKKNYIMDGHQRERVFSKLEVTNEDGDYLFPYLSIEAKDKKDAAERLLLISSQYGKTTQEGLDEFSATFDITDEWKFETINFDALPLWDNTPEAEEDNFEVPPVDEIKTSICKGDLFELKNADGKLMHRILCGDSTSQADTEKLLDGNCPNTIISDPPYGMNLDTDFSKMKGSLGRKAGTQGRKYDKIIGDNEDFKPELITSIFNNFPDIKEIFLFGADYFSELLPDKNKGSWFVWDKRKESQADAFGSEFELIWSKEKHKRRMLRFDWFGFLSSKDGKDARNRVHPTQKPVSLIAELIKEYSKQGESVYDPFVGSGTTLVAGHQLGRNVFAIEISPQYVQVCINRMLSLDPTLIIMKNGKEYQPTK